ncbi:MAG: menaquinone biosynthesis decarboxylase, partial [Campylobacter sp.]|nr:menaquinone biosynthesis decarboxylase [Campylobacter sp.]
PKLTEYAKFSEFVLNRLGIKSLLITEGVCDQLDHASPNSCFGGKLGIDATVDFSEGEIKLIGDEELLAKFKAVDKDVLELRQFMTHTKCPICVIRYAKNRLVKLAFKDLLAFKEHFKLLVFVGDENCLENPYMLVWRVTNNIDALRDIYIKDSVICVDATAKGELEGYTREWPKQTDCTREVVDSLIKRGIVENDEKLFKKFEIFG